MSIDSGNNNINNNKEKAILTSAPPPWHSMILCCAFSGICIYWLPTFDELRDAPERFHTSLFLPPKAVGILRGIFAFVIFATSAFCVWGPGWQILPPYLKSTKLQRVPIQLKGYKTLLPFTSWCWNLLGLSMALSSYLMLSQSTNAPLVVLARVGWEIAAPCALLVSAVVKHSIWPAALRHKTPHALGSYRNLLMHNANAFIVLFEYSLLGGLPVHTTYASLAPLWGTIYLLFTWNYNTRWAPGSGPAYIYFFFDTTIPGAFHSVVIMVLLTVLMTCSALFANAHYLLDEHGWVTRLTFVAAISAGVMRFRD